MKHTIRAVVRRGSLRPLEKLHVPEGKEVLVTVSEVPSERDFEAFRRSAGGWKGNVDAEKLIRDIYASRLIPGRRRPRL